MKKQKLIKKRIYWHGTTSKKKVKSILRNGFNEGTWFANHLEDALEFGGKYVFAVVLKWKKNEKRKYLSWQRCSVDRISPNHILWVEEFAVKRTNQNKKLIKEFFGE